LQFVWAPAKGVPEIITIIKEPILDFGYVSENSNRFVPTLYSYANNFQGFVAQNEAFIATLRPAPGTAKDQGEADFKMSFRPPSGA
jgi:hypothetical protein